MPIRAANYRGGSAQTAAVATLHEIDVTVAGGATYTGPELWVGYEGGKVVYLYVLQTVNINPGAAVIEALLGYDLANAPVWVPLGLPQAIPGAAVPANPVRIILQHPAIAFRAALTANLIGGNSTWRYELAAWSY